jgi:hypothetical protein
MSNCLPPGWGFGFYGHFPWAGEPFVIGGELPTAPPFDLYCIGPCAPMSNILGFVGVSSFGNPGHINPMTEDLILASGGGIIPPGASGITISSAVPGMWTLDFTIDFLNLPVDFSNLVNDHVFVGQQSAPGGSIAGLFFSQAGIEYAPCVHLSGGSLVVESTPEFLTSSSFLVSENTYYSIRIAVSTVSNQTYIYLTKTSDLPSDGYILRYVLPRTPSSSCITPPVDQTFISVNGTVGSGTAIALDSICLGTGLIVPNTCQPIENVTVESHNGQWGSGPWGSGQWGGGTSFETLPVDGGGIPTITSVTPNTGPTTGGTPFAIQGTNLASFFFNDNFNEGYLDTTLWAALGPTLITVAPFGLAGKCNLETSTVPGSYSGIQANLLQPQGDFHVQIDFNVLNAFLVTLPSTEVTLVAIDAAIDSGNYARLSYVVKGASATTGTIRCEVWNSATQIHLFEMPYSTNSGSMGVMRYFDPLVNGNHAAFWLNGTKIFDCFDMPASEVKLRIFAWNEASPYDVQVQLDNFISHSVIVFVGVSGCDVATGIIEVATSRIRAVSPPTQNAWAGAVDLRVTSGVGSCCTVDCHDCWTYTFPAAFVVGRSEPYRPTRREVSLTNDPILRNPGPNIGLGLQRQG